MPFCNGSLPLAARVADALGRMSTAEKLSCLGSQSGAVPSLGPCGAANATGWKTDTSGLNLSA